MDNNLLFEISYTLNEIRDSLSASGGKSSFFPVIAAFGGVVLGFILNYTKKSIISKDKVEKNKKASGVK
ncbi:hypothetical protein [Pantoea coffeiphila]|uniref:Uncharacterized protein n=1 Tax=Pantoea coffeiphila TaxID=1465635 RepID=A0A2S9I6U7_9GAMM|nr:hypothetical protein [Pantoea coffeiphila]PRD13519.1 hypothetical protein CQW29_21095 [Pantoea coffeiphila]